ncbi:hypothetical protein [Pseudonocardia humida]|uniref:Uncharacterized protein n=1 Tax=Pseudonocardia humida TaxID=2800819 RepID=A0ABT1A551_9PSEU|nr:hypothetical protein [Pseudonocardia humida]MCO1658138.1 hypothetical protein [Pseudonocardia humida]
MRTGIRSTVLRRSVRPAGQESRGAAGTGMFGDVVGDARTPEDPRTIRGRGILLVLLGLWAGGITLARGALGTGSIIVWVVLAVGIAMVPYFWFALGVPLVNPERGAVRTRAGRVQAIASAVTFLLVVASGSVALDMAGVTGFWGPAAVVVAAPFVVAGVWTLREASTTGPVDDDPRRGPQA